MKSQTVALRSLITQSRDNVASELDNEVVMMSIERGEYYGLGKIGSEIWNSIAKPTRVNDVVAHFVKNYNVGVNQCQQDVLNFLQKLNDKGLIVVSD